MSSIKRDSIEGCQALCDLNNIVETWALKNAIKIRSSCASCVHAMKDGPFKCTLYNVVPPLSVIINGCGSYTDNDPLPF